MMRTSTLNRNKIILLYNNFTNMTINKLKSSFKTVGFGIKWLDKDWEITIRLEIIRWFTLTNERELRLFKNNNSDIDKDFILIAKKKLSIDDEFRDLN